MAANVDLTRVEAADSAIQESEIDIDEQLQKELEAEQITPKLKLDYKLKTSEERNELVKKIIEQTDPEQLTPKYLEILSDYIIFAMDKEEKQEKKINTPNRMVTVNKRETSFEGICGKLENGEDGIYNMLSDLGKSVILTPQDPITEEDIERIPELKTLRDTIASVEEQYKHAYGKRKYLLKKQIIEMRQEQYIIRNERRGYSWGTKAITPSHSYSNIDFYDDITFDEDGNPVNNGLISMFDPTHIEALLCNYTSLRQATNGKFNKDLYYILDELDTLITETLKEKYPLYLDLLSLKINGKTNLEIQEALYKKYNIKHSIEYISSLWRNKIPKLIAEYAQEKYLIWYYTTQEYGKWKKCSRCGEVKLAHTKFFSKNKSSRDGFYSLCKCCRNAASKKK